MRPDSMARCEMGVRKRFSLGFSLVEILLVIAVIAILVIIAAYKLTNSTVRAKIARVRADLATIAGALTAYSVDHNQVPSSEAKYWYLPLTTPISYLGGEQSFVDPFRTNLPGVQPDYWYECLFEGPYSSPDREAFWSSFRKRHGTFYVSSVGPSQTFETIPGAPIDGLLGQFERFVWYDPTNGTTSVGHMFRSQNGRAN